jgi:hypothetical protein
MGTLLATRITSTLPFVFDANAAPYNCVPNVSGIDQAAAWAQCIADAVAYGKAHDGIAVVQALPGVYYCSQPLQTTDGCYAQIPLPRLSLSQKAVSLCIVPKGGRQAFAATYFALSSSGIIFYSPLTNQAFSPTYGWPSINDTHHGGTFFDNLNMLSVHLISVGFRTGPNPSLCGFNGTALDRMRLEDVHFDTTEVLDKGGTDYYHVPTKPTKPTGVACLPPANNADGTEYFGQISTVGWYAGPGIGELTHVSGVIHSLECYVGLNQPEAAYHPMDIGHSILTRCCYDLARVDPQAGIVPMTALAPLNKLMIRGFMDIEQMPAQGATWQQLIEHIHDPTNVLTGRIEYSVVLGGVGGKAGPLTLNGTQNLTLFDLASGVTYGPGATTTTPAVTTTDPNPPNGTAGFQTTAFLADSFYRADQPIGSPYSLFGNAQANIVSGALQIQSTGGLRGIVRYVSGHTDWSSLVSITLPATADFGTDAVLFGNYIDSANFVGAELVYNNSVKQVYLIKCVNGSFSTYTVHPLPAGLGGSTNALRLVKSGNDFTIYWNGTPFAPDTTDITPLSSGAGFGIAVANDNGLARYLNLSVA